MASNITTITDPSKIYHVINSYFTQNLVFLKTQSGSLNIQFLGLSEGRVAFRVPHVKNLPEVVIVFTRIKTNTLYMSCQYHERNEDTFILDPKKVQIISEARKEDRTLVDAGDSRTVIYINNIMSDSIINNDLMLNDKKIDQIKEIIVFDLEKQFEYIRLFFINESKLDFRMKYIEEKKGIIFIADLNVDPPESKAEEYKRYLNDIYARDYKLSGNGKYISEATVPILYRGIIPYGYVQVNNKSAISDGQLSVVKRSAIVINELFKKYKMFETPGDRMIISDLSKSGCGIVFKDRRQTRFFRKDSLVCFDMLLPTQKKVSVGAIVRNISFLDNSVIKVGFQITEMDAISEVNFDEFLDTLNKETSG